MAETYLLRGARQLLTLRGPSEARRGSALAELAIIPDGAVLFRDGKIEEVGMTRRVENLAVAKKAIVINATGKVVMPAFVDSGISIVHAHHPVEVNAQRLHDGIPQKPSDQRSDIHEAVRALKLMSKKGLILRAGVIAESLARHGTATAGVVTGFGLDETGEFKTLRTIEALRSKPVDLVTTFFGANTTPDGIEPESFVRTQLAPLVAVIARRKLASIVAVRCGPSAYDVAAARPILIAARQKKLARAIYTHQFAADDSVQLALDFDALSLTHLEHLEDHGLEYLARMNTIAVLTPAATIHMGLTRFAPARKLIDRGAAVALATGYNPHQSPSYSMPYTLSMACRYLAMSPAEAIAASTINAAYALGQGGNTGSIEAGKRADLLILNIRDYRELPLAPGMNLIHTVIKSGRIL